MALCVRSQPRRILITNNEEEDDDEEDERSTLLVDESPPYLSSSPGDSDALTDSDVFIQESAFGNFTSIPGVPPNNSFLQSRPPFRRNKKLSSSSKSSQVSPSSSSSSSPRQGSVKKLFRRSVSLIAKSRSGVELSSLRASEFSSPLHQIKESLLHVYRTNTLPKEGLARFHETLARFLMSGGEGVPVGRWWREEVVPTGTRMLAVTVASPKNGDRIEALLKSWHLLYTNTLPLLQALMAPLNGVDVRRDVLQAFRDSVVPYAGLPEALGLESPVLGKVRLWQLKQMFFILARLGPCRCHLKSTKEEKMDGEGRKTRKISTIRALEDENGAKSPPSHKNPLVASSPGDPSASSSPSSSSSSSPIQFLFPRDTGKSQEAPISKLSSWNSPRINEIICRLLEPDDCVSGISPTMLEHLLHLHHRASVDFNFVHMAKISKIQSQETTPSVGQWLTRSPSSIHTLEELLRSAASR